MDIVEKMPLVVVFGQYRTIIDQLPQRGFYVLFFKDGYDLIMPLTAVEDRAEAQAIPARKDHIKVVLDGSKPFRLWFLGPSLGTGKGTINLVAEHSTRDLMELQASISAVVFQPSGPHKPPLLTRGVDPDLIFQNAFT